MTGEARGDTSEAETVDTPEISKAARSSRRELSSRTLAIICSISAGMLGVCLTGVSVLRLVVSIRGTETFADDLLCLDALLFLAAAVTSYIAMRSRFVRRLYKFERIADILFLLSMLLLVVCCFYITYAVTSPAGL